MGEWKELAAALILFALSGCSTTSSSTAVVLALPAWGGPILVSQSAIPSGIEYKVIGSVEADAVVNAKGGRRMTAFSWSAAYVSGIAVKVDNPQLLKALPGAYH